MAPVQTSLGFRDYPKGPKYLHGKKVRFLQVGSRIRFSGFQGLEVLSLEFQGLGLQEHEALPVYNQ